MRFLKRLFVTFFFFFCTASFAGELSQGTLKNGMRYYLWPDALESDVSIAILVQKPEETLLLPISDLFFEAQAPFSSTCTSEMGAAFYLQGTCSGAILEKGLRSMLEEINKECISEKTFGGFLEECKKIEGPEGTVQREIYSRLYGSVKALPPNCENLLFGGQLNKIFRSLLEPKRMAILVTGPFDPENVKENLETLFGDRPSFEENTPRPLLPNRPLTLCMQAEAFGEEISQDSVPAATLLYATFYQFPPSFRGQVLSDLFLILKDQWEGFSVKTDDFPLNFPAPFGYFVSFSPLSEVPQDELDFALAKKELEKRYQTESKQYQCSRHFFLGISEELQPSNQNLLRELETVTLEEYRSFIQKNIMNATLVPL